VFPLCGSGAAYQLLCSSLIFRTLAEWCIEIVPSTGSQLPLYPLYISLIDITTERSTVPPSEQTQIIGATLSNSDQVASSVSAARMGCDQSNWSARSGGTCSRTTTIWARYQDRNNPPPDIIDWRPQNGSDGHSQLWKLAEETQVLSAASLPSTVTQAQINVICRQVLGDHKVQDQRRSCQACSVKC
jgi:hypothetical protein